MAVYLKIRSTSNYIKYYIEKLIMMARELSQKILFRNVGFAEYS